MTMTAGVVGLVTPRYAPAIGGVERIAEMLARGLMRRGGAVEVITTDPTGRLPRVEERDGVLVRRHPTLGHDAVYFVAPSLGGWLLRHAARFALLHAHSYHTPLALQAALVSRWSGVPLVLTTCYHGTGHSPLRRAMHVPYRALGGWILRQARRVICISEAERQLIHRHFGPRVATVVVPSAVEAEELITARPREKPNGGTLILVVGRLDAYKQVDRLIMALPYLPPRHDVVIVGDGPARPQLERLATRCGAHPRLRFLGRVSQDELLAWYRTADIFVSLSRSESFGLAVLEAAVAGSAVVASDIPAHREVAGYVPAGRVSFVSPDCSPAELARAVRTTPRSGRPANVENWPLPTWDSAVDATLACYRAVLGGDRTPVSREAVG